MDCRESPDFWRVRFFLFLSVGPQLLYPSPYVTPPGLMQLHPQSAAGGGVNPAAAAAAAAAAVASGFYDYPTAAYAASQFAANGFDTSFPFGGAAAAAAAAGMSRQFPTFVFFSINYPRSSRRNRTGLATRPLSPLSPTTHPTNESCHKYSRRERERYLWISSKVNQKKRASQQTDLLASKK